MFSVSAAFETAIAQSGVRICELMELELADGSIYRITNHDQNITWDAAGNIYSAAMPNQRSEISFNTSGQFDEMELSPANISGDFYDVVHKNVLETAKLTVKLIRWDASYAADEQIILFVGYVNVRFNRKNLILSCRPLIDTLNIMVPRHVYQEPCNNRLFDFTCGLSRTSYAYSGTATGGSASTLLDATAGTIYKAAFDGGDSGNPVDIGDSLSGSSGGDGVCVNIIYLTASTGYIWYAENSQQFVNNEVITGGGNTVTVNGTPAEDTTFYEIGELEMTGGDNSGQKRPILSRSALTTTLLWPMPNAIAAGDTYKIYPGCGGKAAICSDRFNNKTNFRGFPYIPRVEETLF